MPKKDADKIINHCFSDLIKWTYDDAVFQLTEIFSFTDQECEQLLKEYDILSDTTEEVIMNPAPNFNATAPRDVKDLAENLWQARKYISTAKKLRNPDNVSITKSPRVDTPSKGGGIAKGFKGFMQNVKNRATKIRNG
mgnify:CR=1 FL=1